MFSKCPDQACMSNEPLWRHVLWLTTASCIWLFSRYVNVWLLNSITISHTPGLSLLRAPQEPTMLVTDVPVVQNTAVLKQRGCTLICFPCILNATDRRYSQEQKQNSVIFVAMLRIHKFLFFPKFTTAIDYQSIPILLHSNKSVAVMVPRWNITFAAVTMSLIHRPSKAILQADLLSLYSQFVRDEQGKYITRGEPCRGVMCRSLQNVATFRSPRSLGRDDKQKWGAVTRSSSHPAKGRAYTCTDW